MSETATAPRAGAADLLKGIKIIDVDTHISEPLDLWTSRAPAKYRDRVPQMKMTGGKWVWTIDGDRSMGTGSASSVVHADGRKARADHLRCFCFHSYYPSVIEEVEVVCLRFSAGEWRR